MFDVVEGHVHPKFTGDVGDGYDIALLKLDKKAKGLTRPRLGSGNITITAGDYMAAAGWGKTESAAVAKTLRVTDRLAIVDQKHCEVPPNVTDAGSWICAGGLGEDTCKGNVSCRFRVVYLPFTHDLLRQAIRVVHCCWPILRRDTSKREIRVWT